MASLIEESLPLRKRGRTLVALCPFHEEKTPSFTVFVDTQHFKCFGCQKAGDVFTFVMEREGWDFRQAFEWLAERAGIAVDGVFGSGGGKRPGLDVYRVLGEVRDWFRGQLRSPVGQLARDYLEERGLSAGVEPFGIGYHPPSPSLSRFARERRMPPEVLEQAGLLSRSGREPFTGRVLFPIEDERGRVVGFGGRALADREPKYVNSPESPFFNKRRQLFGLRRVKQAGVRRIVVMEGYTDVVAAHLAGFTGAVATLGTALTRDHARLLERYATGGAVLLFDGDEAGRRAAERAYAELQNSRLELHIAVVGDGVDPADLVSARSGRPAAEVEAGRARLRELVDSAEEATTVWFQLLRERLDLGRAVHVEQAAAECGRILKGVESDLRREALLREMARHLGVSTGSLARMVGRVRRAAPKSGGPDGEPGPTPAFRAELDLLSALLADPQLSDEVSDPTLGHPETAALYEVLRAGIAQGYDSRKALVRFAFSRLAEQRGLADLLAECADGSARIGDPREFLTTLQRGRRNYLQRQEARSTRRRLQEAMAAGDREQADELTRRYVEQLRLEKTARCPNPETTPERPNPDGPVPRWP